MEETNLIKNTVLLLAFTFAMYVLGFIIFVIFKNILKALAIARWKLYYNILGYGKTPKKPANLSIMYQASFFKVKAKLPAEVIEISGLEQELGFKKYIKSLYIRCPKNIYPGLKQEIIYDLNMKPV